MTSGQILQTLLDGNSRFTSGAAIKPNQDKKRREEIAAGGQHPFAIVVTCSDSRVVPELIFDQGLGDLFVVRAAGHVLDDAGLASIEYAAEHLRVPLIVVLGHQRCGAVQAALESAEAPGRLGALVSAIKPAVDTAKTQAGDLLDNAVKANAANVVDQLKISEPILAHLVKEEKLKVVGAYYNLDSGKVKIIGITRSVPKF